MCWKPEGVFWRKCSRICRVTVDVSSFTATDIKVILKFSDEEMLLQGNPPTERYSLEEEL